MKPGSAKSVRCVIYTRVSTDQGLEQDAQYEASQAYIYIHGGGKHRGTFADRMIMEGAPFVLRETPLVGPVLIPCGYTRSAFNDGCVIGSTFQILGI